MQNHLWCPNDPRSYGIDDDDDDDDDRFVRSGKTISAESLRAFVEPPFPPISAGVKLSFSSKVAIYLNGVNLFSIRLEN